jgi:hypothetical protein
MKVILKVSMSLMMAVKADSTFIYGMVNVENK